MAISESNSTVWEWSIYQNILKRRENKEQQEKEQRGEETADLALLPGGLVKGNRLLLPGPGGAVEARPKQIIIHRISMRLKVEKVS